MLNIRVISRLEHLQEGWISRENSYQQLLGMRCSNVWRGPVQILITVPTVDKALAWMASPSRGRILGSLQVHPASCQEKGCHKSIIVV